MGASFWMPGGPNGRHIVTLRERDKGQGGSVRLTYTDERGRRHSLDVFGKLTAEMA